MIFFSWNVMKINCHQFLWLKGKKGKIYNLGDFKIIFFLINIKGALTMFPIGKLMKIHVWMMFDENEILLKIPVLSEFFSAASEEKLKRGGEG